MCSKRARPVRREDRDKGRKRKRARHGDPPRWLTSDLRSLFLARTGTDGEVRQQHRRLEAHIEGLRVLLSSGQSRSCEAAGAAAEEIEYIVRMHDEQGAQSALQCKRALLLAAMTWLPEVGLHFAADAYAPRLQRALALLTPRYLHNSCQAVGQYVSSTVVLADLWGGEDCLPTSP